MSDTVPTLPVRVPASACPLLNVFVAAMVIPINSSEHATLVATAHMTFRRLTVTALSCIASLITTSIPVMDNNRMFILKTTPQDADIDHTESIRARGRYTVHQSRI